MRWQNGPDMASFYTRTKNPPWVTNSPIGGSCYCSEALVLDRFNDNSRQLGHGGVEMNRFSRVSLDIVVPDDHLNFVSLPIYEGIYIPRTKLVMNAPLNNSSTENNNNNTNDTNILSADDGQSRPIRPRTLFSNGHCGLKLWGRRNEGDRE